MLLNKGYLPPRKTAATCQNCQDLNLRDPGIKGILGIPIYVLRRSFESGCPSCGVLIKALELPGLQPPTGEALFGITILSDGASDGTYSEETSRPLIMRLQTEHTHFAEVEIYIEEGFPCSWPIIGPARVISANACSENCIHLMKSWISDCLIKHTECTSSTTALLPDRVLDVRIGQNPSLHINKGNEHGIYAALSHCWGGDVALKLTDDNIENLLEGVALGSLPKTFRHAVEVCRLLEIPYLWIDSLCIIQSSEEDWAVQGSKMDSVYSGCFLVIGADGAHNSKEGFLRDSRRQPHNLKIAYPQSLSRDSSICGNSCTNETYLYARKRGVRNSDVFLHHSWAADHRSKLSTRGWVLQESVLASRILHFTAEEVTWECKMASRCECQVAPYSYRHETPIKHTPLNHSTDWLHMVEEFSCRNLTYPSDRLPAMSGLAASMQPEGFGATYLAGLWSDSLPQSLFWFCIQHGPEIPVLKIPSKRVRPPCAPTWSWASITGRVGFMNDLPGEQNLRDIQVSCPTSGPNRYGKVSRATLTANAFVIPGKVARYPDAKDENKYQVHIFPSATGGNSARLEGETFLDVIGNDELEIQGGDDVILVDQVTDNGKLLVACSLILKANGQAPGIYQRVGLFLYQRSADSRFGQRQTITII